MTNSLAKMKIFSNWSTTSRGTLLTLACKVLKMFLIILAKKKIEMAKGYFTQLVDKIK